MKSTSLQGEQFAQEPARRWTMSSLRRQMRRVERRQHIRALALIAPLLLFLLFFFLVPIAFMLLFAVHDPDFTDALPNFSAALADDSNPVPGEAVFAALARDLSSARERREHGRAIKSLRHQSIEAWRLFNAIVRELPAEPAPAYKEWFLGQSPGWGDAAVWSVVRRAARPYTAYYLLNSLDSMQTPDGAVIAKPETERVYLKIISNTFVISLWVTVATLVLGYPFAHLLATTPERAATVLMALLLVPFWTSLLVRTYAWLMLLQTEGVVNSLILGLGLVSEPLALIHNRTGIYISMVHILLPFMILPIYSVMKGIHPSHMQAATSLGASPIRAFLTVYVPQSLPGVGAGCLLVFIFSLGFYITPALVGGPRDSMISMMIAYNVNQVLNWGMAGALGALLLVATLVVFLVYERFLGLERVRLS